MKRMSLGRNQHNTFFFLTLSTCRSALLSITDASWARVAPAIVEIGNIYINIHTFTHMFYSVVTDFVLVWSLDIDDETTAY